MIRLNLRKLISHFRYHVTLINFFTSTTRQKSSLHTHYLSLENAVKYIHRPPNKYLTTLYAFQVETWTKYQACGLLRLDTSQGGVGLSFYGTKHFYDSNFSGPDLYEITRDFKQGGFACAFQKAIEKYPTIPGKYLDAVITWVENEIYERDVSFWSQEKLKLQLSKQGGKKLADDIRKYGLDSYDKRIESSILTLNKKNPLFVNEFKPREFKTMSEIDSASMETLFFAADIWPESYELGEWYRKYCQFKLKEKLTVSSQWRRSEMIERLQEEARKMKHSPCQIRSNTVEELLEIALKVKEYNDNVKPILMMKGNGLHLASGEGIFRPNSPLHCFSFEEDHFKMEIATDIFPFIPSLQVKGSQDYLLETEKIIGVSSSSVMIRHLAKHAGILISLLDFEWRETNSVFDTFASMPQIVLTTLIASLQNIIQCIEIWESLEENEKMSVFEGNILAFLAFAQHKQPISRILTKLKERGFLQQERTTLLQVVRILISQIKQSTGSKQFVLCLKVEETNLRKDILPFLISITEDLFDRIILSFSNFSTIIDLFMSRGFFPIIPKELIRDENEFTEFVEKHCYLAEIEKRTGKEWKSILKWISKYLPMSRELMAKILQNIPNIFINTVLSHQVNHLSNYSFNSPSQNFEKCQDVIVQILLKNDMWSLFAFRYVVVELPMLCDLPPFITPKEINEDLAIISIREPLVIEFLRRQFFSRWEIGKSFNNYQMAFKLVCSLEPEEGWKWCCGLSLIYWQQNLSSLLPFFYTASLNSTLVTSLEFYKMYKNEEWAKGAASVSDPGDYLYWTCVVNPDLQFIVSDLVFKPSKNCKADYLLSIVENGALQLSIIGCFFNWTDNEQIIEKETEIGFNNTDIEKFYKCKHNGSFLNEWWEPFLHLKLKVFTRRVLLSAFNTLSNKSVEILNQYSSCERLLTTQQVSIHIATGKVKSRKFPFSKQKDNTTVFPAPLTELFDQATKISIH